MNAENPWLDPAFAQQYAADAGNPNRGWYEYEVNFPAIAALIPQNAHRVLDFGCGPGDFTNILASHYEAEGCDTSPAMLAIARQSHPNTTFFEWDFHQGAADDHAAYDTVIAKLVVHFIRDLDTFAVAMHNILQPSGVLVVSVPHPAYTARRVGDYWAESEYHQQIGEYGIYDTMVHRSLGKYTTSFSQHGFVLSGLNEPQVSREQLEQHGAKPDEFLLPKRLNLQLQKV